MSHNTGEKDFGSHTIDEQGRIVPNYISDMQRGTGTGVTEEQQDVLEHFRYDADSRKLIADRAIETTLNSLYLGEQHKMSSGAENIFFTNLGNDTNFYPMWGGLKDQSLTSNQGASGFIPPSGRVYSDLFNLPLGGNPNPVTATGYSGGNFFGVNIAGLGVTTTSAEQIDADVRLEYRLSVNGRQVYMQVLPRNAPRSNANEVIFPNDVIEWWFDHPVEIHAGTTIFAEIHKVREEDDEDLGVFQVRQGDTVDPNTGELRYQAIVHNRLFQDKDLELISPYLKYQAMDFGLDATGATILLRDLSLGTDSLLVPHAVNTLQAVADGTTIQIKIKGGQKIIVESLPVSGVSINGSLVNSVLNNAVTELNNLFTNTLSFTSQGNPVTSFTLSGNVLTLGLQDFTSYTVDVTTLGVDTNNYVASGSLSGSDLTLTMADGTTVIIDATNMINGSSRPATTSNWFISYGANANDAVGTSVNDSTINTQLPFYFGEALEQGAEFKWSFQSNGGANLIMGIWDGAEAAIAYNAGSITPSNWGTMFQYAGGFIAGSNTTLLTTNSGAKYVVANGDAMGIRFSSDGHLTLIDYSGTNEVAVAKTTIPLAVTSFNMQMHTWTGGVLPNGIINNVDYIWDIVHDFANTEAGIINGILDHTVLKSALSIVEGEKIMFMLDEVGSGDFFGTNYTNAASGVTTAEEQLDNQFVYQTNEAIVMTVGGASDWVPNTNAAGYFFAAGLHQYRTGAAGTVQGMFSLRFNGDGKLTIYDEDSNVKVATATADPTPGVPIHLYFGVKGNRAHYSIPVISKQSLSAGNQPTLTFAPDVSNQTFNVTEGDAFSLQIALDAGSDIVNMYGEVDAPSWAVLNQSTGQFIGTAPAFTGVTDSYVVNCKAANAIGGITAFTVTVNVTEVAYTNSKSLSFNGTNSWLQGNPTTMTALERATNGDGNAWSLSFWVKPDNNTDNQTLFVYGAGDDYNGGAITVKKLSSNGLAIVYGSVYDNIITTASGLNHSQWTHVLITFDGGTTGNTPADVADYYSRFNVYLNGVAATTYSVNTNWGYTGAISGANPSDNIFRIGRASNVHNNYLDGTINQVAIWDTDQGANATAIYNAGSTQDLSDLAVPPAHFYEIETSVTSIPDLIGSSDLTGYNFTSSDLVTDTP